MSKKPKPQRLPLIETKEQLLEAINTVGIADLRAESFVESPEDSDFPEMVTMILRVFLKDGRSGLFRQNVQIQVSLTPLEFQQDLSGDLRDETLRL